ncbi:MAG: insulinase family protein [Bacteroidales bacterium]|nr:insulinase family protein [Bacteroidales bacterium]
MKIYKSLFGNLIFILSVAWIGNGILMAQDAAEEFRLPAFEKYTLSNGLTVWLMEQHEVPLIYVSLTCNAGAVQDQDMAGLASLTADALTFGTKEYTRESFEEELDYLGATLNSSSALEYSTITANFLKDDQSKLFELIREVLIYPVFPEEELAKLKQRRLVELQRAKESPGSVIGNYYNKFVLGDHPLATPVSGIKSSIENISREDIQDFFNSNYQPDGACLAIVGDFSVDDMKKAVQDFFGDWKTEKSKSFDLEQPKMTSDRARILLVNKDDALETQFRIGGPGILRNHPDYIPVMVVNTILGGRFTSWLNDELRVNAGLTYGARSSFQHFKESGLFAMSSFTRTPTTVETIDLALEVLDRLHNQGIDQETLSSAKKYVKGLFPLRYETAENLARLLSEMFIYDFDESFVNNFMKDVDAVDNRKAQSVIKKYFPETNLQFVLIGKASEIKDQVTKYGDLYEKEITEEGF